MTFFAILQVRVGCKKELSHRFIVHLLIMQQFPFFSYTLSVLGSRASRWDFLLFHYQKSKSKLIDKKSTFVLIGEEQNMTETDAYYRR